jgi:hypothetical protein
MAGPGSGSSDRGGAPSPRRPGPCRQARGRVEELLLRRHRVARRQTGPGRVGPVGHRPALLWPLLHDHRLRDVRARATRWELSGGHRRSGRCLGVPRLISVTRLLRGVGVGGRSSAWGRCRMNCSTVTPRDGGHGLGGSTWTSWVASQRHILVRSGPVNRWNSHTGMGTAAGSGRSPAARRCGTRRACGGRRRGGGPRRRRSWGRRTREPVRYGELAGTAAICEPLYD